MKVIKKTKKLIKKKPLQKNDFKAEIEELAKKDPEFYEFLKNEEKDIFEENSEDDEEIPAETKSPAISDEDEEEEEESENEEEQGNEAVEMLKAGKNLKVAIRSDVDTNKKLIDSNLLDFFEIVLSDPMAHRNALSSTVKTAIKCFGACVARVSGDSNKKTVEYKVLNDTIFDEVTRICLEKLGRCLMILMFPVQKKDKKIKIKKVDGKITKKVRRQPKQANSTRFKNWHRFGAITKEYLTDTLYVSYISNTKLINAETLPLLSFMQKTFVELTLMYPKSSYKHAFLYIRQFSIHLRNAQIAKRKDLIKTVYNWQFIKGLQVWVMVISQGFKSSASIEWYKELGYPLVEILTILRKIFISPKYLPLRLHCIEMLLQIQTNCKVFIPTLAFCVELLTDLCDITVKKPTTGKGVEKLASFEELIRLSTIQLNDAGYRDLLANELYRIALECANSIRTNVAYSEFLIPIEIKLKVIFTKNTMFMV